MAVNFLGNFNFPKTIKVPSANPNPCPDQVVGEFSKSGLKHLPEKNIDYNAGVNMPPVSSPKKDLAKLIEPIVIILESPHKSEYDDSKKAIGPAQGLTGKLFYEKFDDLIQSSIIHSAISKSIHDVVLVNAVQYQCSLGMNLTKCANKCQKNINFSRCFIGGVKSNDLERRLEALNPFAVINLCTKPLCVQVAAIADQFKNYTCGTHPASWNNNGKIN